MKFEELEDLWSRQSSAPAPATDIAAVERALMPEIRRRGRMLIYAFAMAALGVVVFPLLAIANFRYAEPLNPTWHWLYLGVWMVAYAAALVYLFRQIRRQRAMIRQRADTLRSLTLVSLASREAEMRDYRAGLWLVPVVLGFQLANLAMKFPVPEYGWEPFAVRAGVTVGFTLLLGAVFWRHYRVNLKPDHERQKELLRDLG